MGITGADLDDAAERLSDALDAYEQFLQGRPDSGDTVPENVLESLGTESPKPDTSPGVVLADAVVERYHEGRDAVAAYVEQVREQERPDWSRVVAETEPLRETIQRVHAAGYGVDPDTGEPGYLVPHELCPASRVSMNAGSSPVVYEDRVAQYRAVSDHFDLSPDVVYQPGSGHDVSPSAAFPESRVVYVDVDAAAMADLRRAGYEATGGDAAGRELAEPADVILFRNAGLIEEPIVRANLRTGGWVLANDHLESASHVARLDSLELVGVVPDEWTGEAPLVRTDESRTPHCPAKGDPLDLYVFRDDS